MRSEEKKLTVADEKNNWELDTSIYSQLGAGWEEEPKLKFSCLLLYFPEVRECPWWALV